MVSVRRLKALLPLAALGLSSVVAGGGTLDSQSQSVPLEAWPAAQPAALDHATEALIGQLLRQMSLREKIGQMIQADIASISPAELTQYKLGSILAGGNAAPDGNPRTTPQAWLNLTDTFYRAALAAKSGHPAIPIFFGIDAVHGNAKIIGATIFPHNIALGAAHDANLLRRIGEVTAAEVAAEGIDWTFAPTVAVVRDVRWGRSYESYSEAPQLVAEYAPAMVEGIQGRRGSADFMAPEHTLSSVKHFLGDGGTQNGRDQGNTIVSEAEMSAVHGAGYPPAIKAGAMIVMASYNSWNGSKLHADHHLLTAVLKGRLGFQGFVVGDWNAQEQIPGCTKSSCAAAILAGIDMLMAPDGWKALFENTLAQARAGEIPAARIDDAVRRILRVKAMAGLFTRPAPKDRAGAGDFAQLGSPTHRALARAAVQESLVLLKNSQGVLPLHPRAHILVCGDLADDIGAQTGGWTIDWQGNRNRNADFPGATSIFAGIQAAASAAGGTAVLSPAGEFVEHPDVAVVIFGEHPYAEFQGDLENLEFSPNDKRALALLKRLRAAGIPTVSVFLSGRPLWVNPEINASDAFVAAWLPGSEGEGVADVLFGGAHRMLDFTGRLSFSWPETGMPVRFHPDGSVSGALYARGYGLTYRDRAAATVLSEDARIPPQWRPRPGSLFAAAHATAPWSLFLADGDAQVHVTLSHQSSPHDIVSADIVPEGMQVAWAGTQDGLLQISGRAQDLRQAAASGGSLDFRYRLDAASKQDVRLALFCAEARCGTPHGVALDLTPALRAAPAGAEWHTLSVPLSCFAAAGADVSAVEVPFAIGTAGHLKLTISDVRIESAGGRAAGTCPRRI
ncbi:MAG: exo 1,3/1,4-beta-D-glucan glucohydrolase [Pseudomonadota bacterium]|nr:exo 1,3/1,4-beta-D-glucan glucohydrolase [Pseudomonadota bacterium]